MKIRISWLWLAFIALSGTSAVHAQTAPEGQLSIGTSYATGQCLETRPTDATMIVNTCNATPPQALTYDADTGYVKQAEQCLSAPARGQPLAVQACADKPEQKWNFEENGTMRSDSGVCADILNFLRDPGTPVIAWDCTGTDNQKFFPTRIRIAAAPAAEKATLTALAPVSGLPVIASYYTQGKCLAAATGRIISIENCSRDANQGLRFAAGVSGQIVQGDKCLSSAAKGEPLIVTACATITAQDWAFTSEGLLRNRDNVCADIFAFETRAGTNVIAWDCTGTDNQKFYPALAAESGSFTLGAQLATTLKDNKVTTVSMVPGFSAYNLAASGGRALGSDAKGNITGGQNDTIIVGGAGVMTVRFLNGLAAPSVKTAPPPPATSILPKDWSFFSGATAGKITP